MAREAMNKKTLTQPKERKLSAFFYKNGEWVRKTAKPVNASRPLPAPGLRK